MPADYISQLQSLASQNFLGSLVQEASAKAIALKSDQVQQVIKGVAEERKLINSGELETTQQQLEGISRNGSIAPELQSIEQSAANYQKLQIQVAKQQEDINRVYGKAALALGAIGTEEALNVGGVLDKQRVEELRVLANRSEIPERVAKYAELKLAHSMNLVQFEDYFIARNSKKELQEVEDFIVSQKLFEDMSPYGQEVYSGTKEAERAMHDFDTSAKAITAAVQAKFPNLSPGVLGAAINTVLTTYGKNLTVKQVNPAVWAELALKERESGGSNATMQLNQYNADMAALQSWSSDWMSKSNQLREAIKYYRVNKIIPAGSDYKEETLKDELENLYKIEAIQNRAKLLYPGFVVGNRYGKTEENGRLIYAPFKMGADGKPIMNEKGVPVVDHNDPYKAIIRFNNVESLLNGTTEYNPYNLLHGDFSIKKESAKAGEERGWFQDLIEAANHGNEDRFSTQGSERKPEPIDPNKLLFQKETKAAEELIRSRQGKLINMGK